MGIFEEIGRVFAESEDLTIGIEEEFQILDGHTLALTNRFDDLKAESEAAFGGPVVFSELIQSELEINSKKSYTFQQAREDIGAKRAVVTQAARRLDLALCSSGVHPFSGWREQQFIQSPHYQEVVERLQYVAWTNNTFGMHVHVGVRGADRAIRIHDAYRSYLPMLLALSASSPFFHGQRTGLHSTRAQVFIRAFPRCGIPDAYGDFASYADYAQLLFDTNSLTEPTQIWWTIRPHHTYGTLEIRAADAQPDWRDSMAMAGLSVALVARLMELDDAGRPLAVHAARFLEENRWRALRYGLDGRLIDLDRRVEVSTTEVVRRLLDEVAGPAARLGIDGELARVEQIVVGGNSAQRQLTMYEAGEDVARIHEHLVRETMALPDASSLDAAAKN